MKKIIIVAVIIICVGVALSRSDRFSDWWMKSGGLVGIVSGHSQVSKSAPIVPVEVNATKQKCISMFRDELQKKGLFTTSRVNMIVGKDMIENESFRLSIAPDEEDGFYIQVLNMDLTNPSGKETMSLISKGGHFNNNLSITNGSLVLLINEEHPQWNQILKVFQNL